MKLRVVLLLVAPLTAVVLLPFAARAQILQPEVLFGFPTAASGEHPNELTPGPDGSLYGTTGGGGSGGYGTVFRITTNGTFTTLASFGGTNGAYPGTRLTLGSDGNFYGTTGWGGSGFAPGFDAYGTVFKVTTNGVLTRLVSFAETNPYPRSGLMLGLDGAFYGITDGFDGSPRTLGTVFKVTTGGTLTTLTSIDPGLFSRPLTLGSDGNFYGTTYDGSGRVFKVTPGGEFTWLGSVGLLGRRPNSQGLAPGSDGHLYGTLELGLDPYWTTVFRVDTNGARTQLASYPPGPGTPTSVLRQANDGSFYGGNGSGVSQVLTNGTVTAIAAVEGNVHAAVTFGGDGQLYGVTYSGGGAGMGSIFRLTIPSLPVVVAQPVTQTNVSGSTLDFQVSAFGAGPLSFQWRKNSNNLSDGGNIAGALTSRLTLSNLTPADAGEYSVLVSNHLGSTNSSNATLTVIATVPLSEAFDSTNLTWSTGGDAGWFGQTGLAHDGTDAGRSGSLSDSRLIFAPSSTWVETTVPGPGTLTFWWKVSSEIGYDYLRFSSSNLFDQISGEVDWEQRTFAIPPGPRTLRWRYDKDEFLTAGEDSAWLDEVEFTPNLAPYLLVQPADVSVKAGSNATFIVVATNSANLAMSYQWFFNQTNPVGVSSATLLVTNVGLAQLGGYSVIVSNDFGSVTSRVATLGGGINAEQVAYLKASNTGPQDQFGYAMALSGETLVVSAPFEHSNATGVNGVQTNNSAGNSGAAYVFVHEGADWVQQAYVKASNTGPGDNFGYAVAVDGDTLVIAAPLEDSNATGVNGVQANNTAQSSGAAYVFVRTGTNWTQEAYLKASNTGAGDFFGGSDSLFVVRTAVAISGDTVVVGAIGEDSDATGINGVETNNAASNSGAVYVFVREGTTWTQQAYLKASNTGPGDNFGGSVSISGNTIVVGAALEDSNATGVNGVQTNNLASDSGAAYVFVREGTNWTQQAYLKASNTRPGVRAEFGLPVAIAGDTIIAGARIEASNATGVNGDQTNTSALQAGAAYVFVRDGTNWSQQAYLKASNTRAGTYFGHAVAIAGDVATVTSPLENSNATGVNGNQTNTLAFASGAAYVFVRDGTNWAQQAYLKASNTGREDEFGWSVAISGGTVAAGSFWEDSNAAGINGDQGNNGATDSGAAYIFTGVGPVNPVLPPTISAYEALPNGQFRLRFDSAPGVAFVVLVSTNLMDWTALGPAAEPTPGHFEFTDPDVLAHSQRFYQLRSP